MVRASRTESERELKRWKDAKIIEGPFCSNVEDVCKDRDKPKGEGQQTGVRDQDVAIAWTRFATEVVYLSPKLDTVTAVGKQHKRQT